MKLIVVVFYLNHYVTKFHVLSKVDEGEHGTVMWNNVASTSSTVLVFCHFVRCFGASLYKVASIVMLVINI